MGFDIFDYTNQGGRSYNEDSVAYKVQGNNGIFVVADGLGGHQFGELASATVCGTLTENWNGNLNGNASQWLNDMICASNSAILELQKEKNTVLKSTVVALAIDNGIAYWANSGDSRLYYIHNSEICGITNDHSVAFKKYKAGEITREDLRTDEDQSALLRSIGSEDRFEPELYSAEEYIVPGDAFLLCSDGVWEYLSDEEILIDLMKAENAQRWAELLLLRLMDRINGENDNLTVLTVMVV